MGILKSHDSNRTQFRTANRQRFDGLTTDELVLGACIKLGHDLLLQPRDIQTLVDRTVKERISFVTKTLPMLGKSLYSGLRDGQYRLPSNFKPMKNGSRSTGGALPAFMGSLFLKVFHPNGRLREDACPNAVRSIAQMCFFAYKAQLPFKPSIEQAVLDRFKDVEKELSSFVCPSDGITRVANLLIKDMVQDFNPENLTYKHGPGVTANVAFDAKFDAKLEPIPSVYAFSKHFFFNAEDGVTRLDRYPVHSHMSLICDGWRNKAKVILVPKDSRGPRLISCEPHENQFVQQGIMTYLVDKAESHVLTRGFVNFTDQTVNNEMSRKASLDQSYSTLDLKDASDRVSTELVERLFGGTSLLEALIQCRSTSTVLPDGEVVKLTKHAPMGSAICFPVMAYSLYFLCFAAMLGIGRNPLEEGNHIYVYGDDLIVPTDVAEFLCSVLERYALALNKDKCFINSRFTESCGTDWFDGVLVTPIRLRQCDISQINDNPRIEKPSVLVSLLETANLLAASGYESSAQYLYTYCEYYLSGLPYGTPDSPYLCRWISQDQAHLVAEANLFREGVKWKHVGSNPQCVHGSLFKAWFVTTKKRVNESTTAYGHLSRTINLVGKSLTLPDWGVFPEPKQIKLRLRWVNPDFV